MRQCYEKKLNSFRKEDKLFASAHHVFCNLPSNFFAVAHEEFSATYSSN